MYSESLDEGQEYQELPNVVAINIVDFDFPAEGNTHTCFHIREDTDPSLILSLALEIHFVNMVKYAKARPRTAPKKCTRTGERVDEEGGTA